MIRHINGQAVNAQPLNYAVLEYVRDGNGEINLTAEFDSASDASLYAHFLMSEYPGDLIKIEVMDMRMNTVDTTVASKAV